MELSDEEKEEHAGEDGYGAETDWWSAGAMIYEMVFGVAPFFARDIRSTYLKIVDFRKSLAFPTTTSVSTELCDLLTQYVWNSSMISRTSVIVPLAAYSRTQRLV